MNILETIIHKSDISVAEIADRAGWSKQTVYNYMATPDIMQAKHIVKLARILRRSPRNLFSLIINN